MSKWQNDLMLDAAFDYVAVCDKLIVCNSQPATYDEAINTYALADVSMGGGDFTKADGDTDGRKLTVGAKSAVPVDNTGNATHVALVYTPSNLLVYVTTCQEEPLASGGSVDIPAWDIEIADAS